MEFLSFLTAATIVEYIQSIEPMINTLDPYAQYIKSFSVGGLACHLTAIDNHLQRFFMKAPNADLNSIIRTNPHVIPLSQLTNSSLIKLDFEALNKDDAISKLAKMAANTGLTSSAMDLYFQLKEREEMETTAMGGGIAIPHARTPEYSLFSRPNVIVAVSRKGVNFGSPDGKPVHVFFLICAYSEFVSVRLLAQVSLLVRIPNITEHILKAKTEADVIGLFTLLEEEKILPS